MKDIEGFLVLRKIKIYPEVSAIPFIFLSALDTKMLNRMSQNYLTYARLKLSNGG